MQDVSIGLESPRQDDVIALITELDTFHDGMYPPEANQILDIDDLCAPAVKFLVARRGSEIMGIGALWLHEEEGFGEVKRMFVRAEARGLGLGHQLLAAVESLARGQGLTKLMLETGTLNTEALKLYARAGFTKRGPFANYPDHPVSVFMEKPLGAGQV